MKNLFGLTGNAGSLILAILGAFCLFMALFGLSKYGWDGEDEGKGKAQVVIRDANTHRYAELFKKFDIEYVEVSSVDEFTFIYVPGEGWMPQRTIKAHTKEGFYRFTARDYCYPNVQINDSVEGIYTGIYCTPSLTLDQNKSHFKITLSEEGMMVVGQGIEHAKSIINKTQRLEVIESIVEKDLSAIFEKIALEHKSKNEINAGEING